MYCNHCNQNNKDTAAFCAHCGMPLTGGNPAPEVIPPEPTYEAPAFGGSRNYPNPPQTDFFYSPGDMGDNPEPNAAPQSNYEPQYQPSYTPQYEMESTPRKKNKKLVTIVASVVALALVIGLVVTLVVFSSPQYRIMNGITNSLEELEANLESADTLYSIYENINDLIDDKELSMEVKLEDPGSSDGVQFSFSNSIPDKRFRGDINLSIEGVDADFVLAANEDQLMLQLEQLGDDVYTVPLKKFGKEYDSSKLASYLRDELGYDFEEADEILALLEIDPFAEVDFQSFRKTNDDLENLIKELEIEKVKTSIPNTKDLTVYRTELEVVKLVEIYEKYSEFQMEKLLGKEAAEKLDIYGDMLDDLYDELDDTIVVLYLGVNDDKCLTAIHGHLEDEEDETFSVVLAGKKNIWEEVIFYEQEEEIAAFTIEQDKDGFEIGFFDTYDGERDEAFTIKCKDESGKLVFMSEYGDEFVIKYGLEGKNNVFSFEDEYGDFEGSVSISEYKKAEMPKGEGTSLLEFDENDLEDLVEDIADAFDDF